MTIPLHTPSDRMGAAPVRHQVRRLALDVETLPDGRLRVSTPLARGWAAVVRNPLELTKAVNAAFIEVQLAMYARAHGESYELDAMTDVVPGDPLAAPTRTMDFTQRDRSDIHHPLDWVPLPDGRWRSPAGRVYRADTQMVRRVLEKRRLLGEIHAADRS